MCPIFHGMVLAQLSEVSIFSRPCIVQFVQIDSHLHTICLFHKLRPFCNFFYTIRLKQQNINDKSRPSNHGIYGVSVQHYVKKCSRTCRGLMKDECFGDGFAAEKEITSWNLEKERNRNQIKYLLKRYEVWWKRWQRGRISVVRAKWIRQGVGNSKGQRMKQDPHPWCKQFKRETFPSSI